MKIPSEDYGKGKEVLELCYKNERKCDHWSPSNALIPARTDPLFATDKRTAFLLLTLKGNRGPFNFLVLAVRYCKQICE